MADRRNTTSRDMVVAMVVLVGALLLVTGAMGLFSFSPGGPSEGPDVVAEVDNNMERTGEAMGFTALVPRGLPEEWNANVFLAKTPERFGEGTVPLARAGWLTGDGRFIALIESAAPVADVLTQEIEGGSTSIGEIESGGHTWQVGPGIRNEVVWSSTIEGTSVVITGSALEADFMLMAAALQG